MSVGAGIVWATLIALVAVALWRTTVNKKWKTVGKVSLWIVGIGAAISAAIWGWSAYQDRPRVATGLAEVSLGASPVDVSLALGKPTHEFRSGDVKSQIGLSYTYEKDYDDEYSLYIGFDQQKVPRAIQICEDKGLGTLLGFGHYADEQDVIEKLGQPKATSVDKAGLRKIISYPQWKASFVIEKGTVTGVCASQRGIIEFANEHSDEDYLRKFDPSTAKPVKGWKDSPIVEEPWKEDPIVQEP